MRGKTDSVLCGKLWSASVKYPDVVKTCKWRQIYIKFYFLFRDLLHAQNWISLIRYSYDIMLLYNLINITVKIVKFCFLKGRVIKSLEKTLRYDTCTSQDHRYSLPIFELPHVNAGFIEYIFQRIDLFKN